MSFEAGSLLFLLIVMLILIRLRRLSGTHLHWWLSAVHSLVLYCLGAFSKLIVMLYSCLISAENLEKSGYN